MNDDWDGADWANLFSGPDDDEIEAKQARDAEEFASLDDPYPNYVSIQIEEEKEEEEEESAAEVEHRAWLSRAADLPLQWRPLTFDGASFADAQMFSELGSAMRHNEFSIRTAIAHLRQAGVHQLSITFNDDEEGDGAIVTKWTPDLAFSTLGDHIETLSTALRYLGVSLLTLRDQKVSTEYFYCTFKFDLNLREQMVGYRAYKKTTLQVNKFEKTWNLRDGELFQELNRAFGGWIDGQQSFFAALHPRPANMIAAQFRAVLELNNKEEEISETSMYIDVRDRLGYQYETDRNHSQAYIRNLLWPLCMAVSSLYTREQFTSKSWRGLDKILIDYEDNCMRYIQRDYEAREDDLAAGVLPIDEVVWMALQRDAKDTQDADD